MTETVEHDASELKNTTYELFVAALSILSIANLFIVVFIRNPDVDGVVILMDWILSFIFLMDFTYRIFTAKSKSTYFFRQYGWADLLASFPYPQAKLLRLFRLARAGRMVRKYGARHLINEFLGNRGGSALLSLLFLMVLVLEFGGIMILAAESKSPDSNIKNASDSLWYIYVTITTVGYGDRFPVTNTGRIIGIVVLTLGIGLFGTLTGFLANAFLSPGKADEEAEAEQPQASNAVATNEGAVNTTPSLSTTALAPISAADVHALLAEQQLMLSALQAKYLQLEAMLTGSQPGEAETGA